MNIVEKIRTNDRIKDAFIFLYCAKRSEFLGYVYGGFFSGMVGHVNLEDVHVEKFYTDEEFDAIVEFIIDDIVPPTVLFEELVLEGVQLPKFVEKFDLQLSFTS